METKLQRDVRFLKGYCIVITLLFSGFIVAFVFTAGIRADQQQKTRFAEIDVERINVVEKDGKLKMVISNAERQHPGIIDGRMLDRKRPAGLLFFNDKGDECGGLSFSGSQNADGKGNASGLLAFDRFNQDQTVGLQYGESGGRYYSGLRVWDRPDQSLGIVVDELKKIEKMKEGPEKTAAQATLREMPAARSAERVFVGRDRENASVIRLNDVNGKMRVKLSVDTSGAPKLEFLDENGNVSFSLPQNK